MHQVLFIYWICGVKVIHGGVNEIYWHIKVVCAAKYFDSLIHKTFYIPYNSCSVFINLRYIDVSFLSCSKASMSALAKFYWFANVFLCLSFWEKVQCSFHQLTTKITTFKPNEIENCRSFFSFQFDCSLCLETFLMCTSSLQMSEVCIEFNSVIGFNSSQSPLSLSVLFKWLKSWMWTDLMVV